MEPDTFNREPIAKTMCEYIVKTDADIISPLILDGAWGCGKTTHAKRMQECLQRDYSEEVKCIYWNAASSDYALEPLPMLAAALYKHINSRKSKEFGRKALTLCYGGVKSIVSQLVESHIGINVPHVIENAVANAAEKNHQIALEQQFSAFLKDVGKESLRIEAANSLIQLAKVKHKELIIIIDELDRCRPNFALKLIEDIKHLFDESGCKFILVMNKESIYSAIMHLYGLNPEEAVRYITKYIKMEFQLPRNVIDNSHQESELCTVLYFYDLLEKGTKRSWRTNNQLRLLILYLIQLKSLQLRDIKKLVDTIRFIQSSITEYTVEWTEYIETLICFLAYMLSFEHGLTMRVLAGDISADELMCTIEGEKYTPNSIMIYNQEFKSYLRYSLQCFISRNNAKKLKELENENERNKSFPWSVIVTGGEVMEIWLKYATFVR